MIKRFGIYLGAILVSIMLFSSCSEDNSVVLDLDLIVDAEGADSYIKTIYTGLSDANLYTDAFLIMPLLFSDNCLYAGIQNNSWEQAADFAIGTGNSVNSQMYDDFYNINSSISFFLTEIDTSVDETLTEDVKNGFRAEGRALRAMAYYYLANYWGNVPIITEDTDAVDSLIPNSTHQELFEFMESDLLFAAEHISKNTYVVGDKERMREVAVHAWLARLYLWNGDWSDALDHAEEVIGSAEVALESNIADIYNADSDEHVQVVTEGKTGLSTAVWFLQTFSNGQYVVRPRTTIPFEENDARRDFALSIPGTTILKYSDILNNADPVYLIRKAEMYLLAAEAAIRATGDYTTASTYLNIVRDRAGLGEVTLTSGNFEDALLQERNAELCYEGFHRLLDLRRFGKAEEVLGPFGYTSEDALWPFPDNVLEDFKSLEQNPGYE